MLKTLVAIRFRALVSALFKGRNAKKKIGAGKKILFGIVGLYVLAVYVMLFGMLFYGLYMPFDATGMMALYYAVAAFMALTLSFAGSVFTTQSQLYDANDNELLLSMPVHPWMILVSRMIVLYLSNLLFTAMVMVPAGVVSVIYAAPSVRGVVEFVLGVFLLPLGSLTLSCVFGWLFAWIGSHMRRKNIVSLVVTVAFFAVYFYFISRSSELPQMIVKNADKVGAFIKTAGWRAWQFGQGIAYAGDALAFLRFVAAILLPFAAVMAVLSRSFIGIATRNKGGVKIKYEKREMSVRSVKKALLMKELTHFGASAPWMLNGGIGLLFMLVGPIMVLANAEFIRTIFSEFPAAAKYVMLLLALFECLTMSMTTISAGAVSIEGKSVWLIQSMPVDAKDVLVSKAMLQFAVTLPFLAVSTVLMWIGCSGGALMYAVSLLLPLSYALMMSLLGAALNARLPRLDWTSEAIAVKQGMSILADMGAGFALLATPIAAWALWLNKWFSAEAWALIAAVLYAGVSALLYLYLGRGGKRRFEML
ncbi:MAG: hypothetical protein IKO07_02285 [Clostridia bacterium]|nr:hypothetical protein [Clostridia bacterium]